MTIATMEALPYYCNLFNWAKEEPSGSCSTSGQVLASLVVDVEQVDF
jgi:hypothetical protein